MTEEEQKKIEERFLVELGELLEKYEIRHRGNSLKDKTLRFTIAREVWQLLGKLFTEPSAEDPTPEVPEEQNENASPPVDELSNPVTDEGNV